jgi:HEPN domain-containing protein
MKMEIKNWWLQAKDDLEKARLLLDGEKYDGAAFFSQQAAEKGLKALYLKEHNNLLKIHDLVKLAREVNAPSEIVVKCSIITPVYFEVRYPEGDEPPFDKVDLPKAQELIVLSGEVLKWIEKEL